MSQLLERLLDPVRVEQCRVADEADAAADMAGYRRLPPQFFRAHLGRRHSFLSPRDAQAYDDGHRAFSSGDELPRNERNTPFSRGWYDAECSYLEAREVHA
jgi:hypothetical protein